MDGRAVEGRVGERGFLLSDGNENGTAERLVIDGKALVFDGHNAVDIGLGNERNAGNQACGAGDVVNLVSDAEPGVALGDVALVERAELGIDGEIGNVGQFLVGHGLGDIF